MEVRVPCGVTHPHPAPAGGREVTVGAAQHRVRGRQLLGKLLGMERQQSADEDEHADEAGARPSPKALFSVEEGSVVPRSVIRRGVQELWINWSLVFPDRPRRSPGSPRRVVWCGVVFYPPHTVGAWFGGDGPSPGPLLRLPVCGPTVTAEPWRRPDPSTRSSPPWLFPRYVQEVIQRGRSCVRPACTPVLSVVPAVSDLELSETEYVRPPRVSVPLTPPPAGEPLFPGSGASRRKSWSRPQASGLCQRRRGPSCVTRGHRAREGALTCCLRFGPMCPPAFIFLSFPAGRWGSVVCDWWCLSWPSTAGVCVRVP